MARREMSTDPSIEYLSVLDEDGGLDEDLDPGLDGDTLLDMHRVMVLARRFDDRRLSLQRQGKLGTFAPVKGQEAAQVGAVCAIDDDDWVVPSFRESAASLWRGASMADMLLYDAGYNEGGAVGEGARDLPIAIPVASQIPHAVGIGYALHLDGSDRVVMVFFGDGATSEGDFHEGLNFAGVFDLPVVFVCQNNQWAISTPREEQTDAASLAQKALGYGLPGMQVDGNDVLGVHVAVSEAVDRARAGDGPTLLELCTYRLSVHTTADDPSKYRSEEEEAAWRERDPIPRFRRYLERRDLLTEDEVASLESRVDAEIDAAWERATERMAELEDPIAMFDHVYRDLPPYLEAQREEWR